MVWFNFSSNTSTDSMVGTAWQDPNQVPSTNYVMGLALDSTLGQFGPSGRWAFRRPSWPENSETRPFWAERAESPTCRRGQRGLQFCFHCWPTLLHVPNTATANCLLCSLSWAMQWSEPLVFITFFFKNCLGLPRGSRVPNSTLMTRHSTFFQRERFGPILVYTMNFFSKKTNVCMEY